MSLTPKRDHGGGLDAAIARFGGARADWCDLSTGINAEPYVWPEIPNRFWNDLPDSRAAYDLEQAARRFWNIPDGVAFLAAPGASALIARIPALASAGQVHIPTPTYNEHSAAFEMQGWSLSDAGKARVIVNPNNPDGRIWSEHEATANNPDLLIIDESFADVTPEASLMHLAHRPGTLILKSFGKFWGLAGMRLGFAIGDPVLIRRLGDMLGPWPVSGPSQWIASHALRDVNWAEITRARLSRDAARLDKAMTRSGATSFGGTSLFRLYQVDDAQAWQNHLAQHQIWSRIFPYSQSWLRLGLPHRTDWHRVETACGTAGGAMQLAASVIPADQ